MRAGTLRNTGNADALSTHLAYLLYSGFFFFQEDHCSQVNSLWSFLDGKMTKRDNSQGDVLLNG